MYGGARPHYKREKATDMKTTVISTALGVALGSALVALLSDLEVPMYYNAPHMIKVVVSTAGLIGCIITAFGVHIISKKKED